MTPVEIIVNQGIVVLRARNSELLIMAHHVKALKDLRDPREFSNYFTSDALVNRPARKLFESWLRKDRTVWPRLYKAVHEKVKAEDVANAEAPAPMPTTPSEPVEAAKAPAKEPRKETEKKSKSDAADSKAGKKPVAKKVATQSLEEEKTAPAKKAKAATKKTVSKAADTGTAKKPTAKKATTKKKGS